MSAVTATTLDDVRHQVEIGAKECEQLFQDNKEMQATFVNDLQELQRFQGVLFLILALRA